MIILNVTYLVVTIIIYFTKGKGDIMKNFTEEKKNSTIAGKIKEGTQFTRPSDFVGSYGKGQLGIKGYLKTHSEKYDKDQYSLYIERTEGVTVDNMDEVSMLMNIPSWYGERLEEDFKNSKLSAEDYFADAFIKEIIQFDTRYGKPSYNIKIYDDTTED